MAGYTSTISLVPKPMRRTIRATVGPVGTVVPAPLHDGVFSLPHGDTTPRGGGGIHRTWLSVSPPRRWFVFSFLSIQVLGIQGTEPPNGTSDPQLGKRPFSSGSNTSGVGGAPPQPYHHDEETPQQRKEQTWKRTRTCIREEQERERKGWMEHRNKKHTTSNE